MSNCIFFHPSTATVLIPASGVKEEFFAIIEKAKEMKQAPPRFDEPGYDADLSWAWWFFSTNVETVREPIPYLKVVFGGGESTHTWRDFRGLLIWLRQWIPRTTIHTFVLQDEDPACAPFRFTASIGGPKPKKREGDFWASQLRTIPWQTDEKDCLAWLESEKAEFEIIEDLVARAAAIAEFAQRPQLKFRDLKNAAGQVIGAQGHME